MLLASWLIALSCTHTVAAPYRLYIHPVDPTEQHSFVVASEPGGLSGRLAAYPITQHTTLTELRNLIELNIDR